MMITSRELNIIDYVVCCVGAFASKYSLSNVQAYSYLKRYSGIDFLIDHYEAEHTLSIENAVDDLRLICKKEGGMI
jgi:hypothetical protein